MAWIELHQSLPTHRKTLALADALNIEPVQAVGHLACLWLWAVDNTPNGRLDGVTERTIARAAQWKRDSGALLEALTDAGFLDAAPQLLIHDWHDYAGRLVERRSVERERSRQRRSTSKRPAVDRATTSSNAAADQQTTDGTVPYPTVPVPRTPPDPRIRAVYVHYKAQVQPRSRSCPDKKIAARLKHLSADDLILGIDHFAADSWEMENNASRGAEWFFEKDSRSEHFLLMTPRPKATTPNGRAEPKRRIVDHSGCPDGCNNHHPEQL
jgi:hypothetical protein